MRSGPARRDVKSNEIIFRYRRVSGDEFKETAVFNLGSGGLSVRISETIESGEEVEFELLIGTAKVVRGKGLVAWSATNEDRHGLCFIDLDEHAQKIVELWLAA